MGVDPGDTFLPRDGPRIVPCERAVVDRKLGLGGMGEVDFAPLRLGHPAQLVSQDVAARVRTTDGREHHDLHRALTVPESAAVARACARLPRSPPIRSADRASDRASAAMKYGEPYVSAS